MLQSGFHFNDPSGQLFVIDGQEIPIFLIIWAVLAAAEAALAWRARPWAGLILPGALLVWTVARFAVRAARFGPMLALLFLTLAVENIPTLVLLAVYGLCRLVRGRRLARQMNRSRIEDL